MALVKLYDSHGLSVLYKSAHDSLNLKGVQLESLGFMNVRHSLEWGAFESVFKPIYSRY